MAREVRRPTLSCHLPRAAALTPIMPKRMDIGNDTSAMAQSAAAGTTPPSSSVRGAAMTLHAHGVPMHMCVANAGTIIFHRCDDGKSAGAYTDSGPNVRWNHDALCGAAAGGGGGGEAGSGAGADVVVAM